MTENTASPSFIAESRELLRAMEEGLLTLERTPDDREALNAVFRAMHTIKGSAGVFGLDTIVAFTHTMEELVHEVRQGHVAVDGALVGLLLECGDHVGSLIDGLEDGAAPGHLEAAAAAGAELLAQVRCFLPEDAPVATPSTPAAQAADDADAPLAANACWHISARFDPQVLQYGMDPLSVIRYLETIGRVEALRTVFAAPEAEAMDPQSCHLGLEIRFASERDEDAIAGAFEYVRDDGRITVLPPHAPLADYAHLLAQLAAAGERHAGPLLCEMGALTPAELALADAAEPSGPATAPAATAPAPQARASGNGGPARADSRRRGDSRSVRVDATKLDDLINLVGELVIASAGVHMTARRRDTDGLVEAATVMQRLVEEVRDSALELRMVPIGETFGRFRRVVHDLGRELGKEVDLVLSGTDTELDKSMVEKLADPLTHLLRNALDHGIEGAAARARCGKPARGRIRLHAFHDSGSIVVEVSDDGGGIDREKVLRRAAERGLVAPGQVLGDREIHRLIMEPGFSTADGVTNVSGRGVGLDVVRRNVEALRGSIHVASTPAQGSTFTIRMPLTLAIIDGFMVRVGEATYVMPLEVVVECLDSQQWDPARRHESGVVNLRGEALPVLRLRTVFGGAARAGRRENIVVVQYGGQRAGFVVDELLGEFQTVIKPLGKLFERLAGFSGSTILGTGDVGLILDVPALVQRAVDAESGSFGAAAATSTKARPAPTDVPSTGGFVNF